MVENESFNYSELTKSQIEMVKKIIAERKNIQTGLIADLVAHFQQTNGFN